MMNVRWWGVWMCWFVLSGPNALSAQPGLAALFSAPYGATIAGLLAADGGSVYVTLADGGMFNQGSIVRRDPDGRVSLLYSFQGPEGAHPAAALSVGGDGELYGTTSSGGAHGYGSMFRVTRSGALTVLHHFSLSDGGPALAPLLLAADGVWHGVTWGVYRYEDRYPESDVITVSPGALFTLDASAEFSLVHSGVIMSRSGLTQASNGDLYGLVPFVYGDSQHDPAFSLGDVYRVTPGARVYFGANTPAQPFNPSGELLAAADGRLYGVNSGVFGPGTIFRLTPAQGDGVVAYTTISNESVAYLTFGSDGNLYGAGQNGYTRVTTAGVLTPIRPYTSEIGWPTTALRSAADGSFFVGSTDKLIRLTQAGDASVLSRFGFEQGDELEQLLLARDGNAYGTTRRGGRYGYGVLFRLSDCGLQTLSAFSLGAVSSLATALVEGADGAVYAVTNDAPAKLIRMQAGVLSTVHVFRDFPRRFRWYDDHEALFQGRDGAWYGTKPMAEWSANDFPYTASDIYRFDPKTKSLTVVRSVDGEIGPLMQAASGDFYGIRIPWQTPQQYELFRLSTAGELTILHTFSSETPEGFFPASNLVQGSDGSLYGFASSRSIATPNIVYRWTSDDQLQTVHSFPAGDPFHVSGSRLDFGPSAELYLQYAPNGIWPTGRATPFVISVSGEARKLEPSLGIIKAADGSIHQINPLERDGYHGFQLQRISR